MATTTQTRQVRYKKDRDGVYRMQSSEEHRPIISTKLDETVTDIANQLADLSYQVIPSSTVEDSNGVTYAAASNAKAHAGAPAHIIKTKRLDPINTRTTPRYARAPKKQLETPSPDTPIVTTVPVSSAGSTPYPHDPQQPSPTSIASSSAAAAGTEIANSSSSSPVQGYPSEHLPTTLWPSTKEKPAAPAATPAAAASFQIPFLSTMSVPMQSLRFDPFSFVGGIVLAIVLYQMRPVIFAQALQFLSVVKWLVIWGAIATAIGMFAGYVKPQDVFRLNMIVATIRSRIGAPGAVAAEPVVEPVVIANTSPTVSAPPVALPVSEAIPHSSDVDSIRSGDSDHVRYSRSPSPNKKKPSFIKAFPSQPRVPPVIPEIPSEQPVRSYSPYTNNAAGAAVASFPQRPTKGRSQTDTRDAKTVFATKPANSKRHSIQSLEKYFKPSSQAQRESTAPQRLPFEASYMRDDNLMRAPEVVLDGGVAPPRIVPGELRKELPPVPRRASEDGFAIGRSNTVQSKQSILGTTRNYNKFLENVNGHDY